MREASMKRCNCGNEAKYTGTIIRGFELRLISGEVVINEPPFASNENYCDVCLPEACRQPVKELAEDEG
jgi:hypothetical protein